MRAKFHEQLNRLDYELMQMGSLSEDAINAAVRVLLSDKEEKIKKLRAIREKLDDKSHQIDSMCMRMLIQQQPVARDMNTISYSLKLIRDMERIGAQALELASIAKDIDPDKMMAADRINEMSKTAISMVTDAVTAYVRKDDKLACEVVKRDDRLDQLYKDVKDELTDCVFTDREETSNAIDVLMIAKYLERIGDHAVNMAMWVQDITKVCRV